MTKATFVLQIGLSFIHANGVLPRSTIITAVLKQNTRGQKHMIIKYNKTTSYQQTATTPVMGDCQHSHRVRPYEARTIQQKPVCFNWITQQLGYSCLDLNWIAKYLIPKIWNHSLLGFTWNDLQPRITRVHAPNKTSAGASHSFKTFVDQQSFAFTPNSGKRVYSARSASLHLAVLSTLAIMESWKVEAAEQRRSRSLFERVQQALGSFQTFHLSCISELLGATSPFCNWKCVMCLRMWPSVKFLLQILNSVGNYCESDQNHISMFCFYVY